MLRTVVCSAGFTLMELLVVITIIAILASLLLPATAMVMDSARASRCAGNQRQTTLAIIAYSSDNDGYLPRSSVGYNWGGIGSSGPYSNWATALFDGGILEPSETGIFYCPGETVPKTTVRATMSPCVFTSTAVRSYAGNGAVDDPATHPAVIQSGPYMGIYPTRPLGNPISNVQVASRCVLLGECVNGGISNGGNLATNNDATWMVWRHHRNTSTCFSFVDGHVKMIPIILRAPSGLEATAPYQAIYTSTSSDDAPIDPGRY